MKYAAIIEYIRDAEKVQSIRLAHRQYLTTLLQAGKLVACGPFTDGTGGLIIYEVGSAEEAEQVLKADPFHANGIFVSWVLRPWNAVMVNRELLPPS
jgi:uncharacterized protein YciI